MALLSRRSNSNGFASLETALIAVIVVVIIGIGYYVIHQKNEANKTLSQASTNSSVAKTSPGTTSDIAKITEQDASSEASADNAADSQIQSSLGSANSATSQVGSSYNENNL